MRRDPRVSGNGSDGRPREAHPTHARDRERLAPPRVPSAHGRASLPSRTWLPTPAAERERSRTPPARGGEREWSCLSLHLSVGHPASIAATVGLASPAVIAELGASGIAAPRLGSPKNPATATPKGQPHRPCVCVHHHREPSLTTRSQPSAVVSPYSEASPHSFVGCPSVVQHGPHPDRVPTT